MGACKRKRGTLQPIPSPCIGQIIIDYFDEVYALKKSCKSNSALGIEEIRSSI